MNFLCRGLLPESTPDATRDVQAEDDEGAAVLGTRHHGVEEELAIPTPPEQAIYQVDGGRHCAVLGRRRGPQVQVRLWYGTGVRRHADQAVAGPCARRLHAPWPRISPVISGLLMGNHAREET